jgi:hypothetical protein
MDPEFMKEVMRVTVPRMAVAGSARYLLGFHGIESSSIQSRKNSKKDDLITLRRVIYQSMQLSFQRGKLVTNPFAKAFEFGPNLRSYRRSVPLTNKRLRKTNQTMTTFLARHRNFLRDAIYFLYSHNRIADAAYWYKYNATHYPDRTILDGKTNSFPRNLTWMNMPSARGEDISETSRDRVMSAIEGLIVNAYRSLTLEEDERYAGFQTARTSNLEHLHGKNPKERIVAIGLPPLADIDSKMLQRLLDPEQGVSPEERAVLRTKLEGRIPLPPVTTNAPPKISASVSK